MEPCWVAYQHRRSVGRWRSASVCEPGPAAAASSGFLCTLVCRVLIMGLALDHVECHWSSGEAREGRPSRASLTSVIRNDHKGATRSHRTGGLPKHHGKAH